MLLRYGPKASKKDRLRDTRGENIQRLTFQLGKDQKDTFANGYEKAKRMIELIKRAGGYKKVVLIAVARVNALKKYQSMPSAASYFGNNKDAFIKEAIKASKATKAKAVVMKAKPKKAGGKVTTRMSTIKHLKR